MGKVLPDPVGKEPIIRAMAWAMARNRARFWPLGRYLPPAKEKVEVGKRTLPFGWHSSSMVGRISSPGKEKWKRFFSIHR